MLPESEELRVGATGIISVAERGELKRDLSADDLRPILSKGFGTVTMTPKDNAASPDSNGDTDMPGNFGK